jgi:hypothetical protein
MDYKEVSMLFDELDASKIDITVMLNFERELNGASKEWLQKD